MQCIMTTSSPAAITLSPTLPQALDVIDIHAAVQEVADHDKVASQTEVPQSSSRVKQPRERLPLCIKVMYGLPMLFDGAIVSLMATWMPYFYADVVQVEPSLVGPVTGSIVAAYAFSQPIVGTLSDRIGASCSCLLQGRRRPFLLVLCGPAAIGHALSFNPPDQLWNSSEDNVSGAVWALCVGCICTACLGGIEVMLQALAPVLAKDYDQRTELALADGLCYGIGFACAPMLPAVWDILGLSDDDESMRRNSQKTMFMCLSLFFAVGLLLSTLSLVAFVREPLSTANSTIAIVRCCGLHELKALLTWPSRTFLVYYTAALGSTATAITMMPFFAKYVLNSKLAFDWALPVVTVGSLCCIPIWIQAMYRWEKSQVLCTALVVMWVASGIGLLVPEGGDGTAVFFLAAVVLAIGAGGYACAPAALKPDICDYDELRSSYRQEGRLLALWLCCGRFASALGMGIALSAIAACGFDASLPEQSSLVKDAIRWFGFGVALVAYCIAGLAMRQHPIDRNVLREVQASLVLLRAGQTIQDPLYPKETICWSK